MDVIIAGTIVQALPVQSGTSSRGNQWSRASYIIEHEHGQYPHKMVFDVKNERIKELNLQVGENVQLHFNVDCREYPEGSGKYFNSFEAWKVDRQQPQQQAYQPQYQQAPQAAVPPQYPPQPAPQQMTPKQPAPQGNGQLPF